MGLVHAFLIVRMEAEYLLEFGLKPLGPRWLSGLAMWDHKVSILLVIISITGFLHNRVPILINNMTIGIAWFEMGLDQQILVAVSDKAKRRQVTGNHRALANNE